MKSKNFAKLFIYIPSFNHGKLLEKQLNVLQSQIGKFKDSVRILVNDNCSTDAVYIDIKERYKTNPFISIRTNPGNIMGNPNIALGFVFANPDEYIWILSDNDIITSNALDEIFWALDQEPDIIHIGSYSERKKEILTLKNAFDVTEGAGFGLISVAIIRIDYIKENIFNGFEYIESSFPHLAVILSTLKDKTSANLLCIRHKMVFTFEGAFCTDGEYSLSNLGFLYLADFLPNKKRKEFVWKWLKSTWSAFFRAKSKKTVFNNASRFYKACGYINSFGLKFSIFLGIASVLMIMSKLKNCGLTLLKKIIKSMIRGTQ